MKGSIAMLLFCAAIASLIIMPSEAVSRTEAIDISGVEVHCDVNDLGILQIMLTQEQQEQITENFRNDKKSIEEKFTIDLTGIKGLKGFAFGFYPELSFIVEFMEDVRLFVSPGAALGIGEMSGREYVVLEAVYSFSEDNHINGVELKTVNASGREATHVSGVICFPVDDGINSFALERDGEIIVLSEVQNGLLYSALSLTGKYTLVQVTPGEFHDEIPLWAKSSGDWMSARNVVLGRDGSFCPDEGITRAEFLTLFARLYNFRENSDLPYYQPSQHQDAGDIPDWAVIWMSPKLHFNVESDGLLYPNQIMTRSELVIALGSYVAFFDLFYDESEHRMPFSDADTFTSHEFTFAKILSRMGILDGYDGAAHLNEVATRAQAAQLLCKFAQWQIQSRAYR